MMRHVFLVGFMGAGKSSVARIVAERLGRPFIDLDAEIEHDAGTTIPVIFAEQGEDAFRALETEHLRALEEAPASIVACGGGIVVRPDNRALLGELGEVVYLQVDAAEALARIGDAATRPLLAGQGGPLVATALLQAREVLYRSVADASVQTVGRTPAEVAEDVLEAVTELEAR